MATENFEEYVAGDTDSAIESFTDRLDDVDDRLRKVIEQVDDSAAGIRLEIAQTRRELVEVRATLVRLQGRVDNQVVTLVLSNIASGVGVAALVLAVAHAFT